MYNSAKKLFAVASATAMVLAGVVPFVASAAVHAVGQNVLSSDGTVWMITPQNTRRAYTSGGAFLSYGFNSFANVVAASPEDLSLPVDPAGFIPPQDGSIICSDRGTDKGTCYLITAGMKAGFTSAAVFTGRGFKFSSGQNGDVSFLGSTSNIGDTTSANRSGVLVNKSGTVYLVGPTGLLGIPDITTFNGWGYSFAKVVPANAADAAMSVTGVMATRMAGQLSPTALVGTGCTTNCVPPTGGSLSVSLASNTPAATNVASGAAFIPFTAVNFTAGGSAVTVTGLTLTRSGLGADTNLNNMYLFNGAQMLAQSSSIQSGKVRFTNSSGLFTVPANSTMTVWVKGDIAAGTSSGLTYSFGINSAADVLSNSTGLNGSFPITGNLVTTATVSSPSLATLTATSVAVGTSVNAGTTGLLAGQFSLQAANSAVAVKGVTLTLIGSVNSSTDIKNIKLMANGTQYGTTATGITTGMNTVFFDLSSNPLVIPTGQTVQMQVMADVTGGANRNFLFSVQHNYDIQAYDSTYGVGILTSGSFPVQQATNITVNQGSLTITRDSASRTNAVASSQTNIQLATFDFTANGEDVKVFSLPVTVTVTGGTATLTNLKLVDDTGFGIGTTVSGSAVVGPSNVTGAITSFPYTFGASSNLNYVIPANTTRKVSIVADITSAAGSPVITASLGAGASGNAQGVTSVASITTSASSGNALSVSTSTLSATLNNSVSSPIKVVPGSTQQKVASFSLNAGGADAVNVTTITLTAAAASITGNFQNLKVMVGSTQVGTVQNTLTNSAAYSFSPSTPINIPAGGSVVVDVYADLVTGVAANTLLNQPVVNLTGVTAQLASSGAAATSVTANGQGVTVSTGGVVTISQDPTTPNSRQVSMSSTGVVFGVVRVKETTGNESARITDITLTATAVAGTTLNGSASGSISTLKNITISDGAGHTYTKSTWDTSVDNTTTGTYKVTFNNVNLTIPQGPNSYLQLTVKADVNDFNSGAASNAQFSFGIGTASEVTIRGNASNNTITPTVTANATSNTTTILRTSVTMSSVSSISSPVSVTVNTTGAPSSGEIVAIFNATAGAGGDAILKSINLQQGGNAPTAAAVTYYVYDASQGLSTAVGTATLTGSGAGTITLNQGSAASVPGVTIPSGTTKSFVIKADTNAFNTGSSGSGKSYTLSLTSWSWSDQTTAGLGVSGDQTTVPSAVTRTY